MAYKRSYRRKSNRRSSRYTAKGKSRTFGKRSARKRGIRPRGFGGTRHPLKGTSVRKVTRRMINTVASTKKHNTMPMALSDGEAADDLTLSENQYFFIWSPSYLERYTQQESDATRNKSRIMFRGVKERWFVRTNDVPWMHRRIILIGNVKIEEARPYVQEPVFAEYPQTTMRPLGGRSRLTFSANYNLLTSFFKGVEGHDWPGTMLWDAKADNQKYRIISDTRRVFNPNNDTGKMGLYNTWVEMNLPMTYPDVERGDATDDGTGTGWTLESANSQGQLYFLDIFSRGPNIVSAGPLLIQNQATVYWHEK